MGMHFRAVLAAAAISLTASGAAWAQAGFDGTYAGVSATLTGQMGTRSNGCVASFRPYPLTISGGRAMSRWGTAGEPMQGTVDPQGKVVLHSTLSGRFEGQIDAQGTVKGNYLGACYYSMVWQRQR